MEKVCFLCVGKICHGSNLIDSPICDDREQSFGSLLDLDHTGMLNPEYWLHATCCNLMFF